MAKRATGPKRRGVNLTVREDIIDAAKALGVNASQAAEAGILQAVKEHQARSWLAENAGALGAHNERVEKSGPLLTPDWALDQQG